MGARAQPNVLRLIARGTELKEGFKTLGELKFGHEDTVHFTFSKNRDGGGGTALFHVGTHLV